MLDWNNPLDKTSDNTDTVEPTVVKQVLNDSAAAEIVQIPATIKMAPVNPEDKRVINGQTDINQLAPFKYPRWIEFVDELPKTATGKIQRFKLRAQNQKTN